MRRPAMLFLAAWCVLLPDITAAQGLTGSLIGIVKEGATARGRLGAGP